MFKKISLVLSALVFVACSTTNENLKKPQDVNFHKEQVDTTLAKKIISEVVNDINSVPMSKIDSKIISKPKFEKKKINKFSFSGEWLAYKTSKFLQRRIKLSQVNDSYARGSLILSYLSTNGVETITDEFGMEVFLNDFDIEGFIKDSKTSKIEKIKILRDSKNEFRIITNENSIFFENSSMMFKKKILVKKEKKTIKRIKVENYFKSIDKTVIDSKNNIVWQDTSSAKFLKTNFENAKFYCESLGDVWSLPTRSQIKDTYSQANKKIDKAFKNTLESSYWSQEESIDDVLKAWSFDYKTGKEKIVNKDMKLNIRCVKTNKEIK